MKKQLRHRAKVNTAYKTVTTDLAVFIFEEKGLFYCYCPTLDLYGYGNDEHEAKESYDTNLTEFLKYTGNKDTLAKELKRLGWHVKGVKKNPHYIAPEFAEMVSHNEELNRIMTDIPNVRKFSQPVQIPAYA